MALYPSLKKLEIGSWIEGLFLYKKVLKPNEFKPKENWSLLLSFHFKEICDDPQLFVQGADAADVTQGRVGNCWFVAAAACLALEKDLWKKVMLLLLFQAYLL